MTRVLTPFTKVVRRFPREGLSGTELGMLSGDNFVEYCVERLWDIVATERGVCFDDLSPLEQMDVDFEALMRFVKVYNVIDVEPSRSEGDNR